MNLANSNFYSMIFFNLVENPDAYAKVQKEVDALNAKGPFKGTTLGERYLSSNFVKSFDLHLPGPEQVKLVIGVINETLRLFPPAPEPTQRTNGPGPTTINGKYIPPFTNVRTI